MRRYLGLILTIAIALVVLVALSAVSYVSEERAPESEAQPVRSSYNAGPTGTRAFYQLLEESGYRVARWRESYDALQDQARGAALIVIGPFLGDQRLEEEEATRLQSWVANGGRLLIISRAPAAQFGDASIRAQSLPNADASETDPQKLIDERGDLLIAQPTTLTRHLRGLAISRLATRLKFQDEPTAAEQKAATKGAPRPNHQSSEKQKEPVSDEDAEEITLGPVIHLGDSEGAVLADFDHGEGRVTFLSDPFVVANNGIGRGSNLTLALNLIGALGGRETQIYFDEYHHGYRHESNPIIRYFRGTPVLWLLGQALLLALLIAYSRGRRFARPLPLPQVDRHSPLEFVGSMANLQQIAQARDLALENIYPRFKARLCRALGVSARARTEEIVASLKRRRLPVTEIELYQTLHQSERALAGEALDDQRLITLVATIRRISAQLK